MKMMKARKVRRDTKRVFFKKGTCSRTFFYLLNRELGHPLEDEERAADPLAGGVLQQGHQCGMLWGATLALGAESYRRTANLSTSVPMAIRAAQHLRSSFVNRTQSPDCYDITETDWSGKWSIAGYFFKGRMFTCFRLADRWAPEAFKAAAEGLALDSRNRSEKPLSCAAEVVRLMGGSEAERAMVAGLAGGIGLSGDGCGALGAAVWMHTLARVKMNDYKYALSDPLLEKLLLAFWEVSGSEMACRRITGKSFHSVAEHTQFIRAGGCERLLKSLAEAAEIRQAGGSASRKTAES